MAEKPGSYVSWKEFLRQEFITFQRRIAQLNVALRQQQDASLADEKSFFLDLFELLDAFESLEETVQGKAESMDKTARLLARNTRAIHRKLTRIIEAHHIARISFPDGKSHMEACTHVDSQEAADRENEAILTAVKNGCIHEQFGPALRKAEVIAVRNS